MTELRRRVGHRIRELRQRIKLTQEELGERSGLSYKFIGEVERGAGNPTLESLAAIADGLNVDLADLVSTGRRYPNLTDADYAVLREAVESIEGVLTQRRSASRKRRSGSG